MTLEEMTAQVAKNAPDQAIWLGWSLGGLVASQMALTHPERVQALVTVASSPCFSAREGWPGIKPEILGGFQQQLSDDFQRTGGAFSGAANVRDGDGASGCPHLKKRSAGAAYAGM
ncbi:Biotin synthesis protein BioH [Salmonella enterica subsp. enterica]|uniref:Biotin synthesis protein BioH n=1 Tax=Salmonella enterica I TaxID=59201 RepID=A0A3S4HRA0_SALET|nr:Biotin synthesis protein BioH [Salmonella enterica subsp. enterica]